jgi:DNA polymerase
LLPIKDIASIDDSRKDDNEKLYLAQATSIRFGYSERAKKAATGKNVGTADALGGVYGNIDDGTGYSMAIYRPELYKRKKEAIEKIRGEAGVFKANHPMARKTNIWVSDFTLLKTIAKGNSGALKINALKPLDPSFDEDGFRKQVHACEKCNLRQGCKKPVPASIGKTNIMIIGEAPGQQEDEQNKGFIGQSGQLLFNELKRAGIEREDCIVANVVACRPPNNKLPNILYVTKCPWATELIEKLRPRFILASGNSALYYFKRLNKGITEWSGRTEWSNRAEAWVTYCIHPASILYHRENLPILRKALQEFARVIRVLS